MKLWKRACGVLKDQNSILLASFSRRTSVRNPDIEEAVIKSTSHDETYIDYRNSQRVFAWVRVSPAYLKPLLWAISNRMEKTRSWVVALKGLMLMHGVFCCKVPAIRSIGRLPFDLSNFKDGHTKPGETWGQNAFIHAYYSFLDQKSSFIFLQAQELRNLGHQSMMQELVWLQNLQGLLDVLLQIKPQADSMVGTLILEAMDCVVIEIFDVYSRICNGIAKVLLRIYSADKVEASMALEILHMATIQGEKLSLYFEFCRDIGVINAAECPKVEQIPEEDIRELEHIINGVSDQKVSAVHMNKKAPPDIKDKSIVVRESRETVVHEQQRDSTSSLQTIITNHWEVFGDQDPKQLVKIKAKEEDPPLLLEPLIPLPDLHVQHGNYNEELPDLISF